MRRFLSLAPFFLVTGMNPAAAASPARVDFLRDVQPIFKVSCYNCHGPDQKLDGLRLDVKAAALKGGAVGKVILPGDGKDSPLIHYLLGTGGKDRMPLGFAPLPPEKIALIRAWIDEGAPWPEAANAAAFQQHWAYVKPVRPTPPDVSNPAWVRNPIDAFVLARLDREGLRPSPEASKETLIRRVSLDLTGLPPTLQEVDAFLADTSPDAYEKVVDRLLASPHFGERWAAMWLDLARYADTNGYEKDNRRSMWPYRDWVIDAFNRDMPFPEFTIEQIAGDMLTNATPAQKIASGFHRNTLYNEEGGVDREEQRWLTLVDRVGTTGYVWLGTTLACTQCHDHKYDPFTQKEFYQFLAFFDHADEPTLQALSPIQEENRKRLQTLVQSLDPKKPEDTARLASVKTQLDAIQPASTLVMQEKTTAGVPTTYFHIKGGYLSKGDVVSAGVPAVLPPLPAGQPVNRLGLAYWLTDENNPLVARVTVNRFWEHLFGRGIVETSEDFGTQGSPPTHPELLDWLATEFVRQGWSMKTILRLMVTSSTYRQDSRVTPELLEKDPYNRLLARGPRFRVEAEMVRDIALAASGQLSPKIGGPSVMPPQPDGIWVLPYNSDQWQTSTGEDRYRRSLYTFWRRSAPYPALETFDETSREYCTVRRVRTDTPLQALTTLNDEAYFDSARALARRMVAEGGASPRDRIAYGFRLCTSRNPRPTEGGRLMALYAQELAHYRGDPAAAAKIAAGTPPGTDPATLAALTVVSNVLLNLDETLTKE